MPIAELTNLQRTAINILNENLYDRDILPKQCPLDHCRHLLAPKQDLGMLSSVPIETHHLVLDELDIVSLLTFRRVNQLSMSTVNSMANYDKVVCQAGVCLRMALAINTAHNYTLRQLFTNLCQKNCDGKGCSSLAPFMDVFTLTRRCLGSEKGCPFSEVPVCKPDVYDIDDLLVDHNVEFPARKFHAITGRYGRYWDAYEILGDENDINRTFYRLSLIHI